MSNLHDDTLRDLERWQLAAIIRADHATIAEQALRAAIAGGFRVIEITLNTPGAYALLRQFAAAGTCLVGAGTVMTPADATAAVDAGARFVVSPHCDPDVIASTRAAGAVSIPGTATPTEMLTAVRAGADIVKLFPAPTDIAGTVRQLRGPLPDLRILPTAGVTPANFTAILEAGACAVAFVSSLFDPQDLAGADYAAIQARAKSIHRTHAAWQASRTT